MKHPTLYFMSFQAFLLILSGSFIFSADKILSLNEAISTAFRENLEFSMSQHEVKMLESQYKERRTSMLPKMNLRIAEDASNRYVSYYNTNQYHSGRLTLDQPLLSPGLRTRLDVSKTEIEAAKQSLIDQRRRLHILILETYYGILRIEFLLDRKENVISQISIYLEKLKKLQLQGMVTILDVARVQNQLKLLRQDAKETADLLGTEKLKLFRLMGVQSKTIDMDKSIFIVSDAALKPLDAYLESAKQSNAGLKRRALKKVIAQLKIEDAKKSYYPSLMSSFGYGYEGSEYSSLKKSWTASLSLLMPLWDWGEKYERLQQAKINNDQASLEKKANELDLVSEIEQNYIKAMNLVSRSKVLEEKTSIAMKSHEAVKLKYFQGHSTIDDILKSLNDLDSAYLEHTQSIYDFNISLFKLQSLSGLGLRVQ